MTQEQIRLRARALGLSATATDACARSGIDPGRFAAFYSEMQARSPQGVVATRRAQGREALAEANARREIRFGTGPALMTPHRVGQVRAKPEPSEFERRVEALEARNARREDERRLGPLPQMSASMRERCLARGINPDELAAFRRDMRRGAR